MIVTTMTLANGNASILKYRGAPCGGTAMGALVVLLVGHMSLSWAGELPQRDVVESLRVVTQELADALAPADKAVWERYADPALTYVSEDNVVQDKKTFLRELKPLPKGFTGTIEVKDFQVRDLESVAVCTYVLAEEEWIEGHQIHSKFRETDTWRRTPQGWRLIAAQVLAVNRDPPAIVLPRAKLEAYEGLYVLSAATRQTLKREGNHLEAHREDRPTQDWLAEAPDVFFTPGQPRIRRVFQRDHHGHIAGVAVRREGEDIVWRKQ